MSDSHNTLDIGSLRLHRDNPEETPHAAATTPPEHNSPAAAAARARLEAALPDFAKQEGFSMEIAPPLAQAVPTADLITDKHILAEQHRQAPVVKLPKIKIPAFAKPILTAVGVFFLVLLLFKVPIIINQTNYALSNKAPAAAVAPAAEVVPAEDTVTIPKLNLHVPVNYEPSVREAAVQKALETGVVHYGNTAVPGQNGNVAIFGHSSNDWWEPGNFKFVFVLLDKLSPGDKITIDYQSKRYEYEVTGSKVVEPTDVGVLKQTDTPTLSLITCTPPGTSLKRLVVSAKQINPDPSQTFVASTTPSSAQAPSTLPSGAPSSGFFDQFVKTWESLISSFSGSSHTN